MSTTEAKRADTGEIEDLDVTIVRPLPPDSHREWTKGEQVKAHPSWTRMPLATFAGGLRIT
jgi:hypothetical protein